MIAWPMYDGKPIGTVLRPSSWETSPGIIADRTRSGKLLVRLNHVKTPDDFSVIMHMTLPQYRVFMNWWKNICRKGFYTFAFPQIDDNTGIIKEYQFAPDTKPVIKNTSGDNLEIEMSWMEAT
jgi:hypothetical protein